MRDDAVSIFQRENYARTEAAKTVPPDSLWQPPLTIDEQVVRIAEGAGQYDGDDGVTAPLHPAAVVAIGIICLVALGGAGGLLAALVMRLI